MAEDYYTILEIPRYAPRAQIARAYRRAARRYHPDLHPDDPQAAERFKAIQTAFEVLTDPVRRGAYDRTHPPVYVLPRDEGDGAAMASPAAADWGASPSVDRAKNPHRVYVVLAMLTSFAAVLIVLTVFGVWNRPKQTTSPVKEIAVAQTMLPLKEIAVNLGDGVKLQMVLIPAGSFMMGDDHGDSDDKPVHKVNITTSFYMGNYEVTQAQWQAVMGTNPSYFKGNNLPVENVSWKDCQDFLRKLNDRGGVPEGWRFSLPTEAQWEYACRAGTTTRWCCGDDESELAEYAWYLSNASAQTHAVGEKRPNAWGLYDMHGNVWEWCADWYGAKYYAKSPIDDPTGPGSGDARVLRGGSWNSGPYGTRSAGRDWNGPFDRRYDFTGFRVARTQ